MLGPKQQLLQSYVEGANEDALDSAGDQWRKGESLLRQISREVATRGRTFGTDPKFSGDTALAAGQAFEHSATKMNERADQMQQGAAAFGRAARAVRRARRRSQQFQQHADEQPPTQPPDKGDADAQSKYQTDHREFWNRYATSESDAGDEIAALTSNHAEQAQVFAGIHGEPPPPAPPSSTGSNPVRTGTPSAPTHVPGGGHLPGDSSPGPIRGQDGTTIGDPAPPEHPGTSHTPISTSAPEPTGLPAGPGPGGAAAGPFGPAPAATPGGAGAVGGVGAVAGGALGGAAAAGLTGGLAGGLTGGRGGLLPVSGATGRGLAASGVRGIGTTSRGMGAGSVLGRGAGGTSAGRGGAGRAGAGGTGTRGAGRGAATRGARGAAGSRAGAGAGAGRGGGGGGKDKSRRGEERDLFDDGEDWVDDEDAAPGLLD